MNILFLHRDFPAQFKYLVLVLANNPDNKVMFITQENQIELKGVEKFVYKPVSKSSGNCNSYLALYSDILSHAQAAAKTAQEIKRRGIKPDVIYGFGFWGLNMFMKDIFPDVPLISYSEWFYNMEGADIGFDGKTFSDEFKSEVRCKNSHILVDLYSCDAAITPTHWQKSQFPKEFQDKIKVLHDGIDTEACKPDSNAKFLINDKNLELSAQDEVITYGTRGMEPYRGFPEFMEAAAKILKKRPNAHIVIAGVDKSFYGPPPPKGTYKKLMLEKLNLDLSRVHFVGAISFIDYIKLLQISSAHVYSSFPYILSWSVLNAMSVGCCVVASNTAPVLEVIKDNYNGLLFDFYNVDQLVEKIEYAIDNKNNSKIKEIRDNARKSVVENYDAMKLLPQQINFLNSFIQGI